MGSRTDFKTLTLELGGPVQNFSTSFSGEASLIWPGAGEELHIYNLYVDANSANANTAAVEIRDGAGDPVNLMYVPAGGRREFSLVGRFWTVNTALRITRPGSDDDEITVSVNYRTKNA